MAKAGCTLRAILQANTLFFSPDNDSSGLDVPSLNTMRHCAHQGCELCTVVTAGADKSVHDEPAAPELADAPLQLSRARESTHEEFLRFRGGDHVLLGIVCFRIPSPWS